ncbi:hypothetical protein [Enterovirga aerilata]|uniref:Uncharacterized protein n=1 Tax=Enterovirga aerilata TaxID=2730920 RepID=A0A849IBH6_9HYPH|nr:hypothetical protein [Enterovirga sp. DB1703]NNM74758.1 hypothetical protein [Enterovirga sp. DB1703]
MRSQDDVKQQVAEAQAKAHAAKVLIDNPTLRAAFERLYKDYIAAWTTSSPEDVEKREIAYFRLRALADLEADLEAVANGGKIAAFNNRRTGT